jgi:hypothetical protein
MDIVPCPFNDDFDVFIVWFVQHVFPIVIRLMLQTKLLIALVFEAVLQACIFILRAVMTLLWHNFARLLSH